MGRQHYENIIFLVNSAGIRRHTGQKQPNKQKLDTHFKCYVEAKSKELES